MGCQKCWDTNKIKYCICTQLKYKISSFSHVVWVWANIDTFINSRELGLLFHGRMSIFSLIQYKNIAKTNFFQRRIETRFATLLL